MSTISPREPTSYGARNVLNATDLKTDILARSRARGDRSDITRWLTNHFLRYLVGNFEPARPINTLEDARTAFQTTPLPDWAIRLFETEQTIPTVWIDPASDEIRALESRLVEFLNARDGTRLEGKLDRITCPQALALWTREHQDMIARQKRGIRLSQPEALTPVCQTSQGEWLEFRQNTALLRSELVFESQQMGHCVGRFANMKTLEGSYGGYHAEQIEAGKMRLFTFRDRTGKPHITLSAFPEPDNRLTIDQIKGKQNTPPIARYLPDVLTLLNTFQTTHTVPPDALRLELAPSSSGWQNMGNITHPDDQARLVQQYPHLTAAFKTPSGAAEWLALGLDHGVQHSTRPAIRCTQRAQQKKHATR